MLKNQTIQLAWLISSLFSFLSCCTSWRFGLNWFIQVKYTLALRLGIDSIRHACTSLLSLVVFGLISHCVQFLFPFLDILALFTINCFQSVGFSFSGVYVIIGIYLHQWWSIVNLFEESIRVFASCFRIRVVKWFSTSWHLSGPALPIHLCFTAIEL